MAFMGAVDAMGGKRDEDLLVVSVRCPAECSEAVHAVFHEAGLPGTVEEPRGEAVVISAYLPLSSQWPAIVAEISDRLVAVREAFDDRIDGPTTTVMAGEDWTEAWKKDYKLVRVGRIIIKPSWAAAPQDEAAILVELDPQMAFGSGAHSSTRLALLALQDVDLRGAVIADVGTGTGILSIAAAFMGARKIYATDYDPIAVQAARENARRNGVADAVEVREANLLEGVPDQLDGIVANISPAVDAQLAEKAPGFLKPDGWLILSGFTEASEHRIQQALRANAFKIERRYAEGEWVCLTARLQAAKA